MVFDDLILNNAHSRLFDGELCKGNPHLVGGDGAGEENLIDLLLCVSRIDLLRGLYPFDLLLQLFHAVADTIIKFELHIKLL